MMAKVSAVHLIRPEWLWALLPAAILALLLLYFRGRGGSWSEVISPDLLPYLVGTQQASRDLRLLPFLFFAWVIAAVAAAGPAWEKLPQPIHQKQDALVLALDLSYSMMAQDLSPSRLVRARQKLLDLLEQRGEGQTGLIAYAGDTHIVTPLTDDNPTIANLIPALNPGMMPVLGSDSAAAIAQSIDLLRSAGVSQGRILLITDGVDKNSAKEIASLLHGTQIRLAVLGIGTSAGAPIPLPQGGFIKDSSGNIVIPTLEESALRRLASESGGIYARLSLDDDDLERLLGEALPDVGTQTRALDRTADAWEDKGYLLVLLLLPVVLSLFRRGWVVCLLPVLFLSQPQQAKALSWDDLWLTPNQQGQKALERGDNEAAGALFENQDWGGTAAYRNEDYERAAKQFSETEAADSWYNRGNALAKTGELDEAIAAYRRSLELTPEQFDALENIELLEKMKEQQEQREQQNQQDQDQNEENQDQKNPDQNDENQGQQDPSGEKKPSDEEPEPSDSPQDQEDDQGEDPESDHKGEQAQAAEPSQEDKEKEQALEQWLRRVPDDPSGLLREKFKYESRQREQQGDRRKDEIYW